MNILVNTTQKRLGKHQQLAEILATVKQKLKQVYQDNLTHLILFGSQARGEATPDSDIDILVVLRKRNQIDRHQEIIDLISDLCIDYGVLVSCVYVTESQFKHEKSPLLLNIHREGIVL
jgi:predicted nucleotidyltransferase